MASASGAHPRSPAIDMVKGLAILWVLLIHARPLGESAFFYNVVNHAVPIFVVLFGLNSELWWRRRRLPDDLWTWYRSRARRILVPMWGMLLVFWAMVAVAHPPGIDLTARRMMLQLSGYLAQVGTGWFVTMIVQMVVVFPLFRAVERRWGLGVLLAGGFACMFTVLYYRFWMVAHWGMFGALVFSPRFFGHVAFGMLLARYLDRLGIGAALVSAALIAPCVAVRQGFIGSFPLIAYTDRLVELPLTVLLLALCGLAPRLPLVTAALVWLGQSSYGIYLGQLLVHNAFVFKYGLRLYGQLNLWLYTLELLVGALAFLWLGETVMRVLETTRRSSATAPDAVT
jgi:peptidoglycan/LPS O-acetylase OafA/YrhL